MDVSLNTLHTAPGRTLITQAHYEFFFKNQFTKVSELINMCALASVAEFKLIYNKELPWASRCELGYLLAESDYFKLSQNKLFRDQEVVGDITYE